MRTRCHLGRYLPRGARCGRVIDGREKYFSNRGNLFRKRGRVLADLTGDVRNLGRLARFDENMIGGPIEMGDLFFGKKLRDIGDHLHCLERGFEVDCGSPFLELSECGARHKFARIEVSAIGFSSLVNGGNHHIRYTGFGFGVRFKARDDFGILSGLGVQHKKNHLTIHIGLLGAIEGLRIPLLEFGFDCVIP